MELLQKWTSGAEGNINYSIRNSKSFDYKQGLQED